MPKVSVILPNYNHAKYLSQRIESILGQHFKDFELIILDDASTDNSVEVIEKYQKEPRLTHLLKNETNSGSTFYQWKKGIEKATGQYIWIAESDDVADVTFLGSMVEMLESHNNVGVAFAASAWIDETGKIFHEPDHEKDDNTWAGNSLITNELLIGNLIYNASSAVFRRDLIANIDFDKISTYKYTGDWLFWVQLIGNTQVKRLGKRLNFFRRHKDNVSFKAEREGLLFKEGLQVVYHIFNNKNVPFIKKRATMFHWARRFYLANVTNAGGVLSSLPLELKAYYKLVKLIG